MYDIEKRRNRVASSLLENEKLTADLNDETADELLQWGLTLAENIVMENQDLDDEQAEEAMYVPLKAVRKMMRAINKWLNSGDSKYLETVLKQAPLIYGETAVIPPVESLTQVQTIADLRAAIESPLNPTILDDKQTINNPPPTLGKDNDKEEKNLY